MLESTTGVTVQARYRDGKQIERHVESVDQRDGVPRQICPHAARAGECRRRQQGAHAQFENRHARLTQFLGAETSAGETADVRLELLTVKRERGLGQLPLCTAQSQFPRHQQNLLPHNVIMKQTDL